MALILYFLSDNRLKKDQLEQHLSLLNTDFNLDCLLMTLQSDNFIELENEYFKLRVLSLF